MSLREIPATVAACVSLSSQSPFPGDLTRFLDAGMKRNLEVSPVLCELKDLMVDLRAEVPLPPSVRPVNSLVAAGRVYLRSDDGREELYDLLRKRPLRIARP